mmetsp:Transcript_142455/g.262606  ORF Transcript_142455/g.262606 Transcript_142455/m.262606 type:complete len:83 (+) Transcript_142455:1156-1404(+)
MRQERRLRIWLWLLPWPPQEVCGLLILLLVSADRPGQDQGGQQTESESDGPTIVKAFDHCTSKLVQHPDGQSMNGESLESTP